MRKKSKITNRWSDSVCEGFGVVTLPRLNDGITDLKLCGVLVTNLTTAKSTNCRRRPLHLTPLLLLAEEAGHRSAEEAGQQSAAARCRVEENVVDGRIVERWWRRWRCTLLTAGARARDVERTGVLEHGGDRTTSAGRKRDSPRPSTNGGSGADCELGEWRRERGEETEEEEVGEKKVERFWTGDFGSDRGARCRRFCLLVQNGWRGAPVTGSGCARRAGWVSWMACRLVGCISYRGCTHV
jgi:hypothetical protein